MKYRILGNTGLRISEIGFGAWGIGGNSYGPVDDAVSIDALHCAFDSGITFYDTSDLYGNGHSEEILGTALKDVREEVIIATKGGMIPTEGFNTIQDFSADHLKKALHNSLQRLQTKYVDLYQVHSPAIIIFEQDTSIIPTLEKFQDEGLIRAFGISVRSPDDGLLAIEHYGFKAIQVNFNLIDQRIIDNHLFEVSKQKKVGIIARTPLCFGYLTGTLTGNEQFGELDHRTSWPQEQLQLWAKTPNLFSPLMKEKNRTPTQFALQYCLSFENISTVIPGMIDNKQVKENVQVSEMERLNKKELSEIRTIYKNNTFYYKKTKNSA